MVDKNPNIQALIDSDIYCFRAACSCEQWANDEHGEKIKVVSPVQFAYARLNTMLENTLAEIGTDNYILYLTDGKGNYRNQVYSEYKAGRPPKPIHHAACEEFLLKSWKAVRTTGQEADDAMGIAQTLAQKEGRESVIVTIDKDLNTISGWHYNFVECIWNNVTEEEAQFNFYRQLLMGDTTDNISGCPGIGKVKSQKLLEPHMGNEEELYKVVWETYRDKYPELAPVELEDLIISVGQLVYIRHSEGEMWLPPR